MKIPLWLNLVMSACWLTFAFWLHPIFGVLCLALTSYGYYTMWKRTHGIQ